MPGSIWLLDNISLNLMGRFEVTFNEVWVRAILKTPFSLPPDLSQRAPFKNYLVAENPKTKRIITCTPDHGMILFGNLLAQREIMF